MDISNSTGRRKVFHEEIILLAEEFGYKAVATPGTRDHGVDILAEKNGRRVAIQVKFHPDGNDGSAEVLKLLGGMVVHKATEALFITTAKLSIKATEVCNEGNVVYFDHDRLLQFCIEHQLCLPSWCYLTGTSLVCLDRDMTIGRDPTNTLSYDDPQMSRLHIRLYWDKLQLMLEDCNSSNGTVVNGQRVKGTVRLTYGSKISVGQQRWTVGEQKLVPVGKPAFMA